MIRPCSSARHPASTTAEIATAPLPPEADRPEASPEALTPGRILGTFETTLGDDEHAAYLRDAREPSPVYGREKITHPGLILRLANQALGRNVRLGPWIHVGSAIRNHALARHGDRLAARARVTAEYERKGHRFVELDVLVTANGETSIARIHHTAIYPADRRVQSCPDKSTRRIERSLCVGGQTSPKDIVDIDETTGSAQSSV